MKVCSVVGARPQFVKAAMVSLALRPAHQEVLIHTGQHYDYEMSELFFDDIGLPQPKYNLGVGSSSHGKQTAEMLQGLEEVLLAEAPDAVVVYGDTNSTLAGALAAAKLSIPVAHVEAGLRSYNRTMPEEINRVVTDHVSDVLFCPTARAVANLLREGVTQRLYEVGDVMLDALLRYKDGARGQSSVLERLSLGAGEYYLATIHRPGNTDDSRRLRAVMEALCSLGYPVVLPIHPRTKKALAAAGVLLTPQVKLVEPVGYRDMLQLEQHASAIVTDSGGVQKEAYIFGVPCFTVRSETEWVETVNAGWNVLVGDRIEELPALMGSFRRPDSHPSFFGDGRAAQRIVEVLDEELTR